MRICVFTPAFPPAEGGQEAYALELAQSLAAQGARVRVFTKRLRAEHRPRESYGRVEVRRLGPAGELKARGWKGVLPTGLFLLNATWQLLREAPRYDVILVSGFNLLPLVAVLVRAVTRRPCIVRPESPLEMQAAIGSESLEKMGLSSHSLLPRLLGRLRASAAQRVDRYIAISSGISRALEQAGVPRQRIVEIPNGIDTERFAPGDPKRRTELRRILGLPNDRQIVLYTGRLAVSKGVLMLADVWRELAPQFPAAVLVLAGTGRSSHDDCEAELKAFVSSQRLTDSVALPGNVPDVPRYLQAADIFVFPSDSEGFGLSILEAMAAGLPIVSTRVGVAADFADDEGVALLVPPKNRNVLLEALRRVLADPDLCASLGRRARQAVRAQYSMDAVASRHLQVCAELAGHGAAAPLPAPQNIKH